MRTRRGPARRWTRVLLALGVVTLTGAWWPAPQLDAQTAPFELNGTGAWEVTPLMNLLAGPLDSSPRRMSLNYIARGDRDGRGQLARGEVDFAISGRPLSHEDEAELSSRGVDVIEAPFSLSSIAFLMSAPNRGRDVYDPEPIQVLRLDPVDPENSPPIVEPIPEPFRLTSQMVGDVILQGTGPWDRPDLNSVNGVTAPATIRPANQPAVSVARSDPGALNFYLLGYLRRSSPVAWQAQTGAYGVPIDTQSESWPFIRVATRAGDGNVGSLVGNGQNPDNSTGQANGGVLAPVSTATANIELAKQVLIRIANQQALDAGEPDKRFAVTQLYKIAIPNGAGEYIQPTPDSLTRAAEAGNGAAFHGLAENVAGAYPLTFVENIYVPNKGLSIDATNAVATLMRVQATAGQAVNTLLGEGRLPASLTMTTLLKADEVVQANCKGSDRKLTTVQGGGEYWPAELDQPQSSVLCISLTAPPTTAPTTGGSSGGSATETSVFDLAATSGLGSSGSGDLGSSSLDSTTLADVVADATGSDATAAGASDSETAAAISSEAELPLPLPSTGRYMLDRLITLLLGGAAFLLLRGLLRGRLAT